MSGITAAPQDGATSVFMSPKFDILPMNGPPSLEKARVKPQNCLKIAGIVSTFVDTISFRIDRIPLEANNRHDSQTLEDHSKRRLAPGHASIQQADSGYDEEDEAPKDDLVDISGSGEYQYVFGMFHLICADSLKLPSCILTVDINNLWIASVGKRGAVCWLWWLFENYQSKALLLLFNRNPLTRNDVVLVAILYRGEVELLSKKAE